MARTTTRPTRLPDGTYVHVRSDHFPEECDAIIRDAERDVGHGATGWWLYRVEVTAGQTPEDAQHDDGTVWVWDFEVQPLA